MNQHFPICDIYTIVTPVGLMTDAGSFKGSVEYYYLGSLRDMPSGHWEVQQGVLFCYTHIIGMSIIPSSAPRLHPYLVPGIHAQPVF